MTTSDKLTEADLELALVEREFVDFLDFVQVRDTSLDTEGPTMAFEKWDHLMFVVKLLETNKLLIILKARQVGISWILAAYALWTALYHPGAVVLLLSQGRLEATKLLEKVKFIHDNLPAHLRKPVGGDSTTVLEFPTETSTITALPATPDAGRSETATLVIQDEADYHENLEGNYAAIRPTVDGGGQHIMVSTSNWQTMNSFFKRQYRRASKVNELAQSLKDGASQYVSLFLNWRVRPGRDEEWRSAITADYEPDRKNKEYPETEAQALEAPRSISAFNHDRLDSMSLLIRKELDPTTEWPKMAEDLDPIVHIYKLFHPGNKYAAGTDTSHGVGKDEAVTAVLDCISGEIVADIQSPLVAPDLLAMASVGLLNYFGRPLWGIEDNDWGVETLSSARRLGYGNLYRRPGSGPNSEPKLGWHTDEVTRYTLWGDIITAVRDRLLTVPSAEGLAQFYMVIRNPDKRGRIEAMAGAHDDYPLAVAIAWQMIPYAHRSVVGYAGAPDQLSAGVPPGRRSSPNAARW